MQKVIGLLMIFSLLAQAGFWSSVSQGGVANSLTSSGNRDKIDFGQTKEMKIQQALYGLGFYNTKFDGNLNTRDSLLSINQFQRVNNIKVSGILSSIHKGHLLYLHELYTLLIENKNIDKEKRNQIYIEIDKLITLMRGED